MFTNACTSKIDTESASSPFPGTAPDASMMKPLHPRRASALRHARVRRRGEFHTTYSFLRNFLRQGIVRQNQVDVLQCFQAACVGCRCDWGL